MKPPAIVSVHLPKCGGTALHLALKEAFGDGFRLDNEDRVADPSSPFNIDPAGFLDRRGAYAAAVETMSVVHGHFHPAKYERVEGGVYTTVVREPLERALSHYFYWMRTPPTTHAVWRYVVDHNLDFPAFCRLPWINDLMSGVFFRDWDLARFELVGVADRMDAYAAAFSARFGAPLELPRANETDGAAYAEAKARYLDDPVERARLEPYFDADRRVYETLRARAV